MNELRQEALAPIRRHIAFTALFSALVNILYLSPTLYMLQIYDRVLPTGGELTLVFVTLVIFIALVTLALLDTLRARLLVRAGAALDKRFAGEVLSRQMTARLEGAGTPRAFQAMRDFDVVRQTLSGPSALSLFDAPWTPVYLLFAFLLHPLLGLLTLIGGAVLAGLAILNEKATKARLTQAQEVSARAYAMQEAAAAQGEVVRALGMRQALIARQLSEREQALSAQSQAQFTGGLYSGAIKFFRLFLQSLALGVGAWLAIERQISPGAVIAASILLSRALQPIEQLVGAWGGIVAARVAYGHLTELFTGMPAETPRTQLPAPKGALEVERISVRAPARQDIVLKNVSFAVGPGEIVGVMGPSGSGKTTLARVAAGALTADAGAVRIDAAELKDWDAERLARHVGYLPQDSGLFAGTIKDNISRFEGWRGVETAEVDELTVAAAQAAGVHEVILRLPQGYDTPLGLNGRGLSAGQAQRVALARALYRDPHLLILDEPNSNLDADGETALLKALASAKARGAAILMVAHRSGVLSIADKLLLLKEGVVELFGPKEQVIARLSAGPRAVKAAGGEGG
ncbi:MAG TPA: type I secretion system permease/ATPase [Caulobacteraceae bacterium]|nr:type I secretion system permease/ATPase [Caulobacteraceae bacterium]